jgi:ribosome maturation protein Sdo1
MKPILAEIGLTFLELIIGPMIFIIMIMLTARFVFSDVSEGDEARLEEFMAAMDACQTFECRGRILDETVARAEAEERRNKKETK